MFALFRTLQPALTRCAATAALALAAALPASAAHISLSGNFGADDDIAKFTLTLSAPGALTVTSIGYGGGTTSGGNTVAAGGFDTMLFLYTSSGTLIAQSDDGVNALIDPLTGLGADAGFTTGLLDAGDYILALTQYDNFALGNLADGFSNAGAGNFTPALSGTCPATSFCDWDGNARTSAWTLNFSGDTLAQVVPEPGSLLLVLLAASGLAVVRRSRVQ